MQGFILPAITAALGNALFSRLDINFDKVSGVLKVDQGYQFMVQA